MSLKARLIALTAAALLFSLLAGGVLVYVATAGWLAGELAKSAAVARALVHERVTEAREEQESPERLKALLTTLEDSEHIHAVYVAPGAVPPPAPTVSGLMARLFQVRPVVLVEPLDGVGQGSIMLTADPAGPLSGVRRAIELSLSAIAVVSISALALIAVGLTRGLNGLDGLVAGLGRIGLGDYRVRVPIAGPPEIARIARQFNDMAAQLDEVRARARSLSAQLLTIQEQERRAVARDLHDEIGPCILAASLDLAALQRFERERLGTRGLDCISSLSAVLERMRGKVRQMIERLHLDPTDAPVLGTAIAELVGFWRERCDEIEWRTVDDAAWSAVPTEAALPALRVVQEAVSNAVRHSGASEITLSCREQGAGTCIIEVTDDGIGIAPTARMGAGLDAMRQRVEAMGGTIEIASRSGGGTRVTVALPKAPADHDRIGAEVGP